MNMRVIFIEDNDDLGNDGIDDEDRGEESV